MRNTKLFLIDNLNPQRKNKLIRQLAICRQCLFLCLGSLGRYYPGTDWSPDTKMHRHTGHFLNSWVNEMLVWHPGQNQRQTKKETKFYIFIDESKIIIIWLISLLSSGFTKLFTIGKKALFINDIFNGIIFPGGCYFWKHVRICVYAKI